MNKKHAAFPISTQFLTSLITTGAKLEYTCVDGVPKDAKFIRAFVDREFTSDPLYMLVFEHESFDEVAQGAPLPMRTVEVVKEVS